MSNGRATQSFRIVNAAAFDDAKVVTTPYTFFLTDSLLNKKAAAALRKDFPDITKTGYLTLDEIATQGAFKTLLDELQSDAFAAMVSAKLGFDLTSYPRLVTVMKYSSPKHGRIHTDSASKLATLLVYMNDTWDDGGAGRLRALYNERDFKPFAAEVPPTMGSSFAFLRSDNSWHGHEPYEGERRVVQITWLTSADELERKKKRNSFSQKLKQLFAPSM